MEQTTPGRELQEYQTSANSWVWNKWNPVTSGSMLSVQSMSTILIYHRFVFCPFPFPGCCLTLPHSGSFSHAVIRRSFWAVSPHVKDLLIRQFGFPSVVLLSRHLDFDASQTPSILAGSTWFQVGSSFTPCQDLKLRPWYTQST